ncbi:uncharacterized protein LOC144439206 [Glandiceps talaboti]
MSFSKSSFKRFNEVSSCAPPPGSYNVKDLKKKGGVVVFEKSERFRALKNDTSGINGSLVNASTCSSGSSNGTPAKTLFATPQPPQSSHVNGANKPPATPDQSKMKDLEREMRRLMQQRSEQDRKLFATEQDLQKTEGKLQAALRERDSLQAHVATLEREIKDIQKSNDVLKKKVFGVETHNKRHEDAVAELEAKEKEIAELQMKFDFQIRSLHADLEESRSNITALQDTNAALEQSKQETMAHCEEVEHEVTMLQSLADQLRSENLSLQQTMADQEHNNVTLQTEIVALQETTQEKITELQESLEGKLKSEILKKDELQQKLGETEEILSDMTTENTQLNQERVSLNQQVNTLQARMSQLTIESTDKDKTIVDLQHQVETNKDDLAEEQKKVDEEKAKTADVKEQLEICEQTMTSNLRVLSEKYQSMEDTLATVETDYRKKVDQLTSELHTTKGSLNEVQLECELLRKSGVDLIDQLTSEKEKKETYLEDLNKLKEESSATQSKRNEELKQARADLERLYKKGEAQEERIGELEATTSSQQQQLFHLENELKSKQERVNKLLELSEDLSSNLKQSETAGLKLSQLTHEFDSYKKTSTSEQQNLKETLEDANKATQEAEEKVKMIENEMKKQMQDNEEKNKKTMEEFGRRLIETQKKLTRREDEFQTYKEEAETKLNSALEELQRQQEEFRNVVTELEGQVSSTDETEVEEIKEEVIRWKTLFEELQKKAQPFQEQLDSFEMEKNLLLSQNNKAQNEVHKLSTQYAKLLGHQNQKQKIQHILKIKEENLSLKQEIMKLREQTTKHRTQMRKMEDKLEKLEGKKKFNSSMAFKHSKENTTPMVDSKQS